MYKSPVYKQFLILLLPRFLVFYYYCGICRFYKIPQNYEKPQRFVKEELNLLDDDEDEDEDGSESDENNEFDILTDQQIPLAAEHNLN